MFFWGETLNSFLYCILEVLPSLLPPPLAAAAIFLLLLNGSNIHILSRFKGRLQFSPLLLSSTNHYQLLLKYYNDFFSSNSRRLNCFNKEILKRNASKHVFLLSFFSYSFFGRIESTYALIEGNLHLCYLFLFITFSLIF